MKIFFPRVMALTLAVSLSGCAIVSPRLEPEVSVAGSWNESAPADAGVVTPTWWTGFNSPELASLVTEALAGSPDLAVATERVKQAEAQVRVSGASLFPQLNLDGGASAHRSGNTSGTAPALTDSAGNIELTASYELDLWGKNRAGVRSAESSASASRFDRDTAQLTLVSGVATSYFNVLALRTRLAIARENLDIAQKVMDVVSALPRWRSLGARRLPPAGHGRLAEGGAAAPRGAGAPDARGARHPAGPAAGGLRRQGHGHRRSHRADDRPRAALDLAGSSSGPGER